MLPARALLRLGERLGMRFADERIVISRSIHEMAHHKYHQNSILIPNGVANLKPVETKTLLDEYGLTPYRYVIQVSRLVPGEAPARSDHGVQSGEPAGLEIDPGGRGAGISALRRSGARTHGG